MLFVIAQILILLAISLVLLSYKTPKALRWFLILFFGLFINFQIISIYQGGTVIDYKFYLHLKVVDIQTLNQFPTETRNSTIAILFTFILLFLASRKLPSLFKSPIAKKGRLVALAVLLGVTFLPKGISTEIINISEVLTSKKVEFTKALKNLNINPGEFTKVENVKATPGKNVIILSLESMEKGFITSPKLKGLTPFLTGLTQKWGLYNMPKSYGSDWTAGSLYTFLSGVPCFFTEPGNEMLSDVRSTSIPGISHVFHKAGYNMLYVLGTPKFAGMGDILKTYEIPYRGNEDFEVNYPHTYFGPHDQYLFKEATNELLKLQAKEEPFVLFLSTINTHAPDGFMDEEGASRVPKQKSNLEQMIRSLDYDIAAFFKVLEEEKILDNTVVYIFPDHLLMSLNARALSDFDETRQLYLLTNADEEDISFPKDESIYQIDLAKIILEGAQVKHNVKFFTDFIDHSEVNPFIENNRSKITQLNISGVMKAK